MNKFLFIKKIYKNLEFCYVERDNMCGKHYITYCAQADTK